MSGPITNRKKSQINAKELEVVFEEIMKDTREATVLEKSLSLMTALPRNEWAKVRRSLLGNNLVEKVEGAIMHVCLDDMTSAKGSIIPALSIRMFRTLRVGKGLVVRQQATLVR